MVTLYNCRHSGDQYRITKFDDAMNVESSYLTDGKACDCPAGVRPRCRHREMLPKFIARGHIGDEWFFDFDRGGWVQMGTEWASPEAEALDDALQPQADPSIELSDEDELAEVEDAEEEELLAQAGLTQAPALELHAEPVEGPADPEHEAWADSVIPAPTEDRPKAVYIRRRL